MIYNNILASIESKASKKDFLLVKIPYIYKNNNTEWYNYRVCIAFCIKELRENNFSAVYRKPNCILIGNLKNRFNFLFKQCTRAREPSVLMRQYTNMMQERDHHLELVRIYQRSQRRKLGIVDEEMFRQKTYIEKPEIKKTPALVERDFYKTLGIDDVQECEIKGIEKNEPPKEKKKKKKKVVIDDVDLLNIISKNKRYSL